MNDTDRDQPSGAANQREPVIRTRNLTRYFGDKAAVLDMSISVARGSVFAFLGRNGSGKSTAIRMMLGLLEPTRGSVTILGYDSGELPPAARASIGYMAENHPVFSWMRVEQCASFQRAFYAHWNHDIFAAVIDHFSIDQRVKAGHLSHGQRAGLCLAMTLAPEPELLVLDDPDTGLDPVARRALLEAMLYFTRSGDRTIFFSSHLLDDVERVADYIAVLDRSVLRACVSVETFRARVRQYLVRFPSSPPQPLPAVAGLLQVARIDNELALVVANPNSQMHKQLDSLGALVVDEQPISLEDALIAYVGRRGEKSFLLKNLGGPQ
jgi:ABC-2 type transport system ATP-binding protein